MKIAIPVVNGLLCQHFGHCQEFALFDVEDNKITNTQSLNPPAHEPGLLPKWLNEQGANLIITGGMGGRAKQLFQNYNIEVISGAPSLEPIKVVEQYIANSLVTGDNACDH